MSIVAVLHGITKQLYEHLQKPLPVDDEPRERYIHLIDFYLEKRALRLASAERPSEAEVNSPEARAIVTMNEEIEQRLAELKRLIGQDVHRARTQKDVSYKYDGVYAQGTDEGYFFDRKN